MATLTVIIDEQIVDSTRYCKFTLDLDGIGEFEKDKLSPDISAETLKIIGTEFALESLYWEGPVGCIDNRPNPIA